MDFFAYTGGIVQGQVINFVNEFRCVLRTVLVRGIIVYYLLYENELERIREVLEVDLIFVDKEYFIW